MNIYHSVVFWSFKWSCWARIVSLIKATRVAKVTATFRITPPQGGLDHITIWTKSVACGREIFDKLITNWYCLWVRKINIDSHGKFLPNYDPNLYLRWQNIQFSCPLKDMKIQYSAKKTQQINVNLKFKFFFPLTPHDSRA